MSAEPHPRHQLNEALMHPVRFSLVASLAAAEEIDFPTLRDMLQVSDSVLSRQGSQLESLGLVGIRKGYVGKRPRPWPSLPKSRRQEWNAHHAALPALPGQ